VRDWIPAKHNPIIGLLALTAATVAVHGYHLGVDDAEIYVPGIKHAADPRLYPFGSEFFMTHAHLSLFQDLVGGFARLTRLPPDLVIFLCHLAGVFLLLLAAWRLSCACFQTSPARWGAVGLLAGVLSVPVAGTALVIMDPYVTARTLSAPATLFAVACFVSNQRKRAFAWLLFTAAVHPQMSVYGAVLLGCIELARRRQAVPLTQTVLAAALPLLWGFQPPSGPAREALLSRTYFFLSQWAWYEWIGAIAPLLLLWWFSARPPRGTTPVFQMLARTLVPFGLLFTAAGLILTYTPPLLNYTRLQPMRAFHLIYVIFFVLLGGLIAEYVLGRKGWRWVALFVPLAAGMWILQQSAYPFSPHVECPGGADRNPWAEAFLWIRANTPRDAVFALDPNYLAIPQDDQHGFRAVAERSVLADNLKDSGAVSLFPQLAAEWKQQVQAQTGWARFHAADFQNLARRYPVTWVVVQPSQTAGLACPYQNAELAVCRIDTRSKPQKP
jgi:hypothetical protein